MCQRNSLNCKIDWFTMNRSLFWYAYKLWSLSIYTIVPFYSKSIISKERESSWHIFNFTCWLVGCCFGIDDGLVAFSFLLWFGMRIIVRKLKNRILLKVFLFFVFEFKHYYISFCSNIHLKWGLFFFIEESWVKKNKIDEVASVIYNL